MSHQTRTDLGLTAYAAEEQPSDTDFVIPEDLSALTDEELSTLHEQAVGHFDALFGDGQTLAPDDLEALAVLTEGIETMLGEVTTRRAAQEERAQTAAELATRVHHEERTETIDDSEKPDPNDPPEGEGDPDDDEEHQDDEQQQQPAVQQQAAEPVTASARKEIRVNLGGLRSRQNTYTPKPAAEASTMRDVVLASGDGSGYAPGSGLEWSDVGRILDRRLTGFNQTQYAAANRAGNHLRQQFGIATVRKPMADDLVVQNSDPAHVDAVMRRAVDETRLPGGSLTAAGGWCAPSEVIYDLCELESRDGLFSMPEIGITRGGISWTTGPDFADIYNDTGFSYTEQNDIDGEYGTDANGVGNGTAGEKPCYRVECPDFTEARLGLTGLCITAGLLQQRGYPEVLARTVRGALIAHDHKTSASVIAALVAGSTAVTMPTDSVGTIAPLLTAIELQVEHYRYSQRMARSTTLEAVFPYWIRGALRSDLALRAGSPDHLSVTDAQINAWFSSRGINAQFVYDWQDINGTAATAMTHWPTTVRFLLYAAGTWVKGTSDVITLDTIYDSVLLGQNDFTALFTEEGWLVAKLCRDSRVVTAPVCTSGATGGSVTVSCNGSLAGASDTEAAA